MIILYAELNGMEGNCMNYRVVITGLGAVTPIGNNVKEFFDNVKAGVCGIDFITGFDTENFEVKLAASVKNFDPKPYIDVKESRRMDRFSQFAVVAAAQALEDAAIDPESLDKDRFGVIVGSGIGGLANIEKQERVLLEKGPRRIDPLFIPMVITNMAAGNIAIKFGARGICSNVVTACATGSHCIGEAFRYIKHGYADVILAGGTEASITPLGIAGFNALKALSTSKDPLRASIPFDKERDGFVMGEGAGILLLEEYEHAKKRGAKIYAEIVGYGATCDAYHITAPDPEGYGGTLSMKNAMNEAGITPKDISYVNAHGTSTPINDRLETLAMKAAFGKDIYNIPISSTKSMIGHLLGAAGAVEAIVCVKAIEEGFIPATIGLKVKDEECDLDYVPNTGREGKLSYVMSNSLGFGGHNASLIFKNMEV
ncbi:3-oxoacyl-[acyl-carrier-protein] synthase II [Herbinix hemicellulosilytica]|uniref:3-oxoacyl-[acyl-carrier-protein] synthase 2 n=2 Tax=Herbinix hemicellulosilytica TaxID=1564487 RepID=A0A0H5STG4_HERHM|nr:beta-ketoacyl-ACP synthase II [Herbinix hemicellulosilytica]RBP60285.1 3-oxoacyl-[acyl-carrier-protein] synthase II [Herbinix hemicellulosilytica]CRZ33573.1 3-oxoacyl-[acyl-carrier-protein] synthase 2 [Herbinix hemicellulosilytica]